jgi:hypothetical protein
VIHFLTPRGTAFVIRGYMEWRPELPVPMRAVAYEDLVGRVELQPGVYVFTDLERLDATGTEVAGRIHDRLTEEGDRFHVLNDPRRSLRRPDLLRRLAEVGWNDFRAFPASERLPALRYPVFLRHEALHTGAISPLLHDRRAVDRALAEQLLRGHDPDQLLVVEFCDTSRDGTFEKYSAFAVADRVIARHRLSSRHWMLKEAVPGADRRILEKELRYVDANPHGDRIREVFDLAGMGYGRIDYSMLGDRMQVWEINSNGIIVPFRQRDRVERAEVHRRFAERFDAALRQLDVPAEGSPVVMELPPAAPTPLRVTGGLRGVLRRRPRLARLARGVVRATAGALPGPVIAAARRRARLRRERRGALSSRP